MTKHSTVPLRPYRLGVLVSLVLARVFLFAVRAPTLTTLRILRPFILWPLLLAAIGGAGFTLAFAAADQWHDATKAGLATAAAALLTGLYSGLVRTIETS